MARDDFLGWVEGRVFGIANLANVVKFIWEDIVCRYGSFRDLVFDGGPENKDNVIVFRHKYGFRRVQTLVYNFKANNIVERGYSPIIRALLTLIDSGKRS